MASTNEEPKNVAAVSVPLVVAEYSNLRAEVLTLLKLKHQLSFGALVVLGAFLTLGLQSDGSTVILLLYPMFGFFLSAGWSHKHVRTKQIAKYIRVMESMKLEGESCGLGWGNHIKTARDQTGFRRILDLLSATGIFVVAQGVVIALSATIGIRSASEWILLVVDLVFLLGTILVIGYSPGWKRSISKTTEPDHTRMNDSKERKIGGSETATDATGASSSYTSENSTAPT